MENNCFDGEEYTNSELDHIVSLLESLSDEVCDPSELAQKLTEAFFDESTGFQRSWLLNVLERGLSYGFEEDEKAQGGMQLGHSFSSDTQEWPPPLYAVSEKEKQAWETVAQNIVAPLPKTHLLDLAFSTEVRPNRTVAEKLANAYVALASHENLDTVYRVSCLRRAWTLGRSYGLALYEADARRHLYDAALQLHRKRGIDATPVVIALEPLTIEPRSGSFQNPNRDQVRSLLKKLWPETADTGYLPEKIVELFKRVAESSEELEEVETKLVENYLALADSAETFTASHWLEKAIRSADKFGLIRLRDQAIAKLQEVRPGKKGMHKHAVEMRIPLHIRDARLFQYRWSYDTLTALDIWFTSPSPTGNYERNLQSSKEYTHGSLVSLVTRMTFNSDGLPVKTSTGPHEAEVEQLERIENMNAALYGSVIATELNAIKLQHGTRSSVEIHSHLVQKYACDPHLAFALAEAIETYWEGRISDAGRTAYPLIEAGARGLLLTLGTPLYLMPTKNRDGRFPSLDAYVQKLEDAGFDSDWSRALRNPISRLRNALAHGHKLELNDYESALLIRTAALLVVLTPADSTASDNTNVDMRLRDPLGWIAQKSELVRRWRRVWVPRRERKRRTE